MCLAFIKKIQRQSCVIKWSYMINGLLPTTEIHLHAKCSSTKRFKRWFLNVLLTYEVDVKCSDLLYNQPFCNKMTYNMYRCKYFLFKTLVYNRSATKYIYAPDMLMYGWHPSDIAHCLIYVALILWVVRFNPMRWTTSNFSPTDTIRPPNTIGTDTSSLCGT